MPLTENDAIRIRQFLQRLDSGLIEGMEVFATYHDSNLASTPSNPTGDGTTGGWHREPTEVSNWMSVKTALKDTSGTWGTPIRVFGLQGTETAGVGLSADIPKLSQITFIGDGSSKVGWTAGTVEYGGNSYAIAVKAVGDGSTDAYIYFDDADGQTSFKTTGTFTTAIAAHHWVVCFNDSGKAIPATSARILHGGLIQAGTIIAVNIAAQTITYEKLKQTAGSEAVNTDAMRDDATRIYETATIAAQGGYIGSAGTYTILVSDNIVSEGGVIVVTGVATLHNYATSGGKTATVRLYEGVNVIAEEPFEIEWASSRRVFVGGIDIPGSGSATYHLKATFDVAGACKASLRTIILDESKGK